MKTSLSDFFKDNITPELFAIAEKLENSKRISTHDCLYLFENAEMGELGILADFVRIQKHGDVAFFNKNFHIEPTNICIHNCKFCSYRRRVGQKGSWEHSLDEIKGIAESYAGKGVTEVHIVGGVHPERSLTYYGELIETVKKALPEAHIKAFTAVEVDNMFKLDNLSNEEGFRRLKEYGLDSMPGGGAEIFDEELRAEICPDKSTGARWLEIHEAAHNCGIPTNSTILYGHVETFAHRVDHLNRLRELQDKTNGFNCFIPLKFRRYNNSLSKIKEVTSIEDMRMFAISRIFLDNIPHIKAYWPMLGKDMAKLALSFGADDLDGTIDDSTQIYSMAGVEESGKMTTDEIVELIRKANRKPVERDTLYNVVKEY